MRAAPPDPPSPAATGDAPHALATLRQRYSERHRWYVLCTAMVGIATAIAWATLWAIRRAHRAGLVILSLSLA